MVVSKAHTVRGGGPMTLRPPSGVPAALIFFLVLSLTTATLAPQTASAQQKITLRFWMSADPALEAAMDALLQEYMKANPNIAVQRDAFPFNEYHQKLATAFAAGEPPDGFWVDVRTAAFASEGSLPVVVTVLTTQNNDDLSASRVIQAVWKGRL